MAIAPQRPRLRPVDRTFVMDRDHGKVLVLRDTEGIAPRPVVLPGYLAAVVARFDGAHTADRIAAEATRSIGRAVDAASVVDLAAELDAAFLMETPRFEAKRRDVLRAFSASPVRPAAHAGGAYHGDAGKLGRYIEDECLSRAPARPSRSGLVGICAPHMDLWRAAVGYGHAYRALAAGLGPEVDTFVLLGTSHAYMRRPFAVCEKAFATPLGALEPDREAIAELAAAARFDVREDEYLHKNEHSLEFQAVFLRHALGDRPARIVPILCGLGDAQATATNPSGDAAAESFLAALEAMVDRRRGRVLLIAGADLAHVGPRFGDPGPLDERGRERLGERDDASIALALERDHASFFEQVAEDLDTRRVCGLGPIYTMLRALPGSRGERLHYAQHVDPDEGSIVSHTSLAYWDA